MHYYFLSCLKLYVLDKVFFFFPFFFFYQIVIINLLLLFYYTKIEINANNASYAFKCLFLGLMLCLEYLNRMITIYESVTDYDLHCIVYCCFKINTQRTNLTYDRIIPCNIQWVLKTFQKS